MSSSLEQARKEFSEFEEKVKRSVLLSNLSPEVTAAVLKMALEQFGNVVNIEFVPNLTIPYDMPQCALVEMEDAVKARKVIKTMKDFPFMISGMPRPVSANPGWMLVNQKGKISKPITLIGRRRQNCLKRVREERDLLLRKIRSKGRQASSQKEVVESTFWHIVTDELEKIKVSPLGDGNGISNSENDDILWEYDQLCSEIESEDLMMEMERILYRDLREEKIRRELELIEEEDDYLARAVFEHMQINDEQALKNKIWCPICKRGELKETHHLIHCTNCNLQLDLADDKVNLEFLRTRLAEVHMEHLDRGCRALPEFCIETKFDLTALYIRCIGCSTFEIVL